MLTVSEMIYAPLLDRCYHRGTIVRRLKNFVQALIQIQQLTYIMRIYNMYTTLFRTLLSCAILFGSGSTEVSMRSDGKRLRLLSPTRPVVEGASASEAVTDPASLGAAGADSTV